MARTDTYKRIVWTTAGDSLMSHDGQFGVRIRKSRNQKDRDGTYVIETDDFYERRRVDKLVALYDSEDVE